MNSGSKPYSMKSWVRDVLENLVIHDRDRLGFKADLALRETL